MFRVWKWLWGAIFLAALTASLKGWLEGTFDAVLRELLPSGAAISCIGREWIIDHRPFRQPEPKRQVFRVLVAALDNDDADRRSTGAIVRALQGEKGIEAIKTCRVLPIEGAGVRIEEPVAMQGREWLLQHDADVLVFGETIEKGALNLHFLAPKGGIDFHQNAFKLESGFLKEEFKEALTSQLLSFVFATVDISDENRGRYLVETSRPVAARLEQLLLYPPSGLSARQLAAVQLARGVALTKIGYQADDNRALEESVTAFRAVLKEVTRERAPLDWAMTQRYLGNALSILGEHESGTGKLTEAVAAYRAALEEQTLELVPLDWALTQGDLGLALTKLGEHESRTGGNLDNLKQAVVVFGEVLEKQTSERDRFNRAETQIDLCLALTLLGEYEQAINMYHEALKEVTRERAPLDWAVIQISLGKTLVALGEHERGTDKFEEAVTVFGEVLKELTSESNAFPWATAQGELGRAFEDLGGRTSGTVMFQQAVVAYGEALKVFTRLNAHPQKEIMITSLQSALYLLDQRRLQ